MSEHKAWLFRPDDYVPETPEEWHDVTTYGDDWEVEMNIFGDANLRGTWRHRPVSFTDRKTDWVVGRPPTGFYAKPEDKADA
jgi:hypothetical protein